MKAMLVSFYVTTRVVVDDAADDDQIIKAARQKIIDNGIEDYLNSDNVELLENDDECPYDPETDEVGENE